MLFKDILFMLFMALPFSQAFSDTGSSNLVFYWGQASAGSQENLAYYCEDDTADVLVISFITAFPGTNGVPSLNFAGACYEQYSNGLLHCSQIAEDIKTCQSKGKKVLISLGGAAGSYGFSSDNQAKEFADTLWDLFGEGTSSTRPFDDAVVDGFDLDIENNLDSGYAALVDQLRENYKSGSKKYYVSGSPQCPIPDASLNTALTNADFDFAFIQFYNNYCSIQGTFNFNDWVTWAQTASYNKNIKLYLGLPGSPTAAGSGYVDEALIASTVSGICGSPAAAYFGGISVWDASQAWSNKVSGDTFASGLRSILDDDSCQNASPSLSQNSSTTASFSSSSSSSLSSSSSSLSSSSSSSSSSYPISGNNKEPLPTTALTPEDPKSNLPPQFNSLIPSTTILGPKNTSSTALSLYFNSQNSTLFTLYPSSFNHDYSTLADPTAASSTSHDASNSDVPNSVAPGDYSNRISVITQAFTTDVTTMVPIVLTISDVPITTATPSVLVTTVNIISPVAIPYHHAIASNVPRVSQYLNTTTPTPPSNSNTTTPGTLKDCSGLKGLDKAKCFNSNFSNDSAFVEPCVDGDIICRASGALAKCDHLKWVTFECAAGTTCYAFNNFGDDVFITCNFISSKSQFF